MRPCHDTTNGDPAGPINWPRPMNAVTPQHAAFNFGIVNPLTQPWPEGQLESAGWSLAPERLRDSALMLPYLLPLDALDQSDQTACCALLESDQGAHMLAAHLRRQLVMIGPDGLSMLLRLYDARVMAQLRWILTTNQIAALLGPVRCWSFEYRGQRETLSREGSQPNRGWHPTPVQYVQIERIGLINRVLAKADAASAAAVSADGQAIDVWLRRGLDHGLARQQDLVTFGLQGLTRHADFDRHRRIRQLLAEARAGRRPYYSASRGLSEDDWQRMAVDLKEAERTAGAAS